MHLHHQCRHVRACALTFVAWELMCHDPCATATACVCVCVCVCVFLNASAVLRTHTHRQTHTHTLSLSSMLLQSRAFKRNFPFSPCYRVWFWVTPPPLSLFPLPPPIPTIYTLSPLSLSLSLSLFRHYDALSESASRKVTFQPCSSIFSQFRLSPPQKKSNQNCLLKGKSHWKWHSAEPYCIHRHVKRIKQAWTSTREREKRVGGGGEGEWIDDFWPSWKLSLVKQNEETFLHLLNSVRRLSAPACFWRREASACRPHCRPRPCRRRRRRRTLRRRAAPPLGRPPPSSATSRRWRPGGGTARRRTQTASLGRSGKRRKSLRWLDL